MAQPTLCLTERSISDNVADSNHSTATARRYLVQVSVSSDVMGLFEWQTDQILSTDTFTDFQHKLLQAWLRICDRSLYRPNRNDAFSWQTTIAFTSGGRMPLKDGENYDILQQYLSYEGPGLSGMRLGIEICTSQSAREACEASVQLSAEQRLLLGLHVPAKMIGKAAARGGEKLAEVRTEEVSGENLPQNWAQKLVAGLSKPVRQLLRGRKHMLEARRAHRQEIADRQQTRMLCIRIAVEELNEDAEVAARHLKAETLARHQERQKRDKKTDGQAIQGWLSQMPGHTEDLQVIAEGGVLLR